VYTIKTVRLLNKEVFYIKEINNYFVDMHHTVNINDDELRMNGDELRKIISKALATDKCQNLISILDKKESNRNFTKPAYEANSERYTLNLHPSRKCNLSCKYCFKDVDYLTSDKLSIEVAQKAIDFLVDNYGANAKEYFIDLSGSGEPLLNFELIKQIADYASIKRNETGKEITICFCNNGTLIDDEKAAYLINAYRFLLGISIDGNKKHNVNRLYSNGKDTFEDIIKGINALSDVRVGYAITITHENEAVDEIYDFIYGFSNCDAISMMVVRDYSNDNHSFYKINVENLIKHYEILCQNIIKHINAGDYEYLFKILKGADTFGNYINKIMMKGLLNSFRCDGGYNRISVDNNGIIYSCPVMNGCDEFIIGNLCNGVNMEKVQGLNKFVDDVTPECKECWAAYICSGPCNAQSFYTTGKINMVDKKLCHYKKSLIALAIAFVCELENNKVIDFSKIQRFVASIRNFTEANYAVWALFWLFKHRSMEMKFEDIASTLSQDEFGVSISEVEKYIRQLNNELDIYIVEDINSYSEVMYPAIAYINKAKTTVYTYCMLLGEHEENLEVKRLDYNESIFISKDTFMETYSDIIIF